MQNETYMQYNCVLFFIIMKCKNRQKGHPLVIETRPVAYYDMRLRPLGHPRKQYAKCVNRPYGEQKKRALCRIELY